MYHTCQQIRNELNNKKSLLKKCVNTWINGLDQIIECIDEYHYRDNSDSNFSDSDDSDQLVKMENINYLIKDIIKTLELFKKKKIVIHKKNKSLLFKLSKIITRHLFTNDIELDESDLIKILDFINWDCSLLFLHAVDWATSEEDAGYNIVEMIKMANIHKKKLTGFADTNVIYALLKAVHHCNNEEAEQLIIDKNVKLTKDLNENEDGMIYPKFIC
jgi:hypothetical protein